MSEIITADVEFSLFFFRQILRQTTTTPWLKLKSANQQESPEEDIKDETAKFPVI